MFQQWCPRDERSTLVSLVRAGAPLGTILSFPVSSFLCSLWKRCTAVPSTTSSGFSSAVEVCTYCRNSESYWGICSWTLVFYTFGFLGILWCLPWFFLVCNHPSDHRCIAFEEIALITYTNLEQRKKNHAAAAAAAAATTTTTVEAEAEEGEARDERSNSVCCADCRTVPWLALATHPAAWAIYLSHFSVS